MRSLLALISSSVSSGHHLFSRLRTCRSSTLAHHVLFSHRGVAMNASEEILRIALAEKQSAVEAQGNAVREMKSASAAKPDIDAAIEALNGLKLEKASIERQLQTAVSGSESSLTREAFRQAVANTLERRLFYIPSFKIYRGVAGLYDYGPPGCAVKSNVLAFWRQVSPKFAL
jgi:glycyl-tRNA synthetase